MSQRQSSNAPTTVNSSDGPSADEVRDLYDRFMQEQAEVLRMIRAVTAVIKRKPTPTPFSLREELPVLVAWLDSHQEHRVTNTNTDKNTSATREAVLAANIKEAHGNLYAAVEKVEKGVRGLSEDNFFAHFSLPLSRS
jgi:hypothetical protein